MLHMLTNGILFALTLMLAYVVWRGGLGEKFNAFFLLLIVASVAAMAYHFLKQPVLWLLIGLSCASALSLAAGWVYFVQHTPSIMRDTPTNDQK